MTQVFKKGDKVVAVDVRDEGGYLEEGGTYTVAEVGGNEFLYLKGIGFYAYRFELVQPLPTYEQLRQDKIQEITQALKVVEKYGIYRNQNEEMEYTVKSEYPGGTKLCHCGDISDVCVYLTPDNSHRVQFLEGQIKSNQLELEKLTGGNS
jgi:hypothetical protein